MSSNAALDVAIGLMLLYLVLGLMGTVINELIATFFGLRASTLAKSLDGLLSSTTLKADFYNNGLISSSYSAAGDRHPSYLPARTFAMAVLASLDVTQPIPGYKSVEGAVQTLPDCDLRDVLLAQLATANGDLEKLRDGIATWFDNFMDRASGVYKRQMKWISLVVGLALATILGADTLQVTSSLWRDPVLRAAVAADAASFVSQMKPPEPGGAPPAGSIESQLQNLATYEAELRPLPLGWTKMPSGSDGLGGVAGWWILKAVGLALTGLAVSLGAPFWFDVLSKFVRIRGTGEKPERTSSSSD